jgi:hypothetical protein
MLARRFLHYQADRPKITGDERGLPSHSYILSAHSFLLTQMLARKFLHYQADRPKITGDETEEELTGPPPPSLFLLAACMVKVRVLRFIGLLGLRYQRLGWTPTTQPLPAGRMHVQGACVQQRTQVTSVPKEAACGQGVGVQVTVCVRTSARVTAQLSGCVHRGYGSNRTCRTLNSRTPSVCCVPAAGWPGHPGAGAALPGPH